MKPIHLGFLCALLLGGSELAAKGGFLSKLGNNSEEAKAHLTRKLKNPNGKYKLLEPDAEEAMEASKKRWNMAWDGWLFVQYVKAQDLEAKKKIAAMRSAASLHENQTNVDLLASINERFAPHSQLDIKQVKEWIFNIVNSVPAQVGSSKVRREKGCVTQCWSTWVKKPEAPVASQLKLPEQPGPGGVKWVDDAEWDSPREDTQDPPSRTRDSHGKGQDQQ